MQKKERVIVGMSGGIDSSVAAALLVEQGYDVIGITMKTYKYEDVGGNVGNDTSCCSLDGINDARRVAMQLGIPHYVVDFTETFRENIIDYFINEYVEGNTPNPCVRCNKMIKWEAMIAKADKLGAEFIATGHYARIRCNNETGRYEISRGRDMRKDQSYALWGISQKNLARTIFPLSDFTKEESRETAKRFGLPVAEKQESYEICFIPDNDYRRFLKDNVEPEKLPSGEMKLHGDVVGAHEGTAFYTIGQRRGLNVPTLSEPLYVTHIDGTTNTVELGFEKELFHRALHAREINLIKYNHLPKNFRCTAKIRYKDEGSPCTIEMSSETEAIVTFDEARRAITPGQSVVFYEGDDIVGGGIISEVLSYHT